MSRFRHTPAVWLALPCCFGAVWFSTPNAHAQDAEGVITDGRSGFTFDLGLSAGGATAELTESDYPIVDFEALTLGVGARWGWFVGHHVLLGAELTFSWNTSVGTFRVHDTRSYFAADGPPTQASYEVIAPLGVFVALYPWQSEGVFFGASAAVGLLALPRFAVGDTGFMSGYSLDVGYELSRSAKRGPSVFLRYGRWAAEESPFSSENPDGLVSRELLLGVRWSFWTPEWR